jgi:phosphoribosylformylglycinamidine synthase subunit PurL
VQNNTVILPGGADAAVVRLRSASSHLSGEAAPQPATTGHKGCAATVDCNARYVYLHPYEGAKSAVAEAARNLSCVGAEPIAVTDNLNFGSPEHPTGYWQLAEACRGLAEACAEFATPVTGGNVSLYNETLDDEGNPQPIYPTPVVGMVGLIEDLQRICGQGWQKTGDLIYLLGKAPNDTGDSISLGGSEYLSVIHKTVAGIPPLVNFTIERQVQAACRHGIRQGWIRSAHDSAEGGLAVALAESCISGDLGASVTFPSEGVRGDRLLFAEGGARIIVSIDPAHKSLWETHLCDHLDGYWQPLGEVGGGELKLQTRSGETLIAAAVSEMAQTWGSAIENRLASQSV